MHLSYFLHFLLVVAELVVMFVIGGGISIAANLPKANWDSRRSEIITTMAFLSFLATIFLYAAIYLHV